MFSMFKRRSRELVVVEDITPVIDLNSSSQLYVMEFDDPFKKPIYVVIVDEKQGYTAYKFLDPETGGPYVYSGGHSMETDRFNKVFRKAQNADLTIYR